MAYVIKTVFDNGNNGVVESAHGKTETSFEGKSLSPYELFLGGYTSCLHSTFKSIANKKRIPFESATYDVVGVKREEVPTYLKEMTTVVTFTGVEKEKEKAIEKSMTLASKYCSISAMIKMVTEVKYEIVFK